MPIPFLIAGAALIAGAYGAKKGYDAYDDYDTAKTVNNKAKNLMCQAEDELNEVRVKTQNSFEALGRLKFEAYEHSIVPFVEFFSQIKNIEDLITIDGEIKDLPDMNNIKLMNTQNIALKKLVGGGLGAIGAGGLAGLAAYGGVGAFAAASTGTAISGLSGVAATNATLAWLGGGSLASGGFGMAGGMAVLGGIVAGPVLAVGGIMLASKAEAMKEDAYSNLALAKTAVEEMKNAQIITEGIQKRVVEISLIINQLHKNFKPFVYFIQELTLKSRDYNSFSKKQQEGLYMAHMLYETLSNLLEVDIIDKDGNLTQRSKEIIATTKQDFSNNSYKLKELYIADMSFKDKIFKLIGLYNEPLEKLKPTEKKSLENIIKQLLPVYRIEIDNFTYVGKKGFEDVLKVVNQSENTIEIDGIVQLLFISSASSLIALTSEGLYVFDSFVRYDDIYSIWIDEDDKVHINEKIFVEYGDTLDVMKFIVAIIKENIL